MSAMMKRLHEEHDKLRALSAEVCAMVTGDALCDVDQLARKRWELASMVYRHLAFEERQVFQRLHDDPRPEARMMSARCRDSIHQLHLTYKAHVDAWSAEDIAARWPAFRTSVKSLVAQMNARIGFEEKHLFPLLGADPALLPTRFAGARNWAGDGVALEGAIKLRSTVDATAPRVTGTVGNQRMEGAWPASAH